jgi:hypothetical protein
MAWRTKSISTTVPEAWADELDRLATVRIDENNGPVKKASMIREGIRLYLQQRAPENWEDLELGPAMEPAQPPDPIIEATAEEIPLDRKLLD